MPRFPRPEMAARLEALMFDDSEEWCWVPVAERNRLQREANHETSQLVESVSALPVSREEDPGLRLANAIAAAVYGPRGELREK